MDDLFSKELFDFEEREKKYENLRNEFLKFNIPLEKIGEIVQKYAPKSWNVFFKSRELQQLGLFHEGLAKKISNKNIQLMANWCDQLAHLLAGDYAISVDLLDPHISENTLTENLYQKHQSAIDLQLLISNPAILNKKNLFTASRVLTELLEFRKKLEKDRKHFRIYPKNRLDAPKITEMLVELVIFIDKKINENHGGFHGKGDPTYPKREKKYKDKSYHLAGLILEVVTHEKSPPIENIRARLLKPLKKHSINLLKSPT